MNNIGPDIQALTHRLAETPVEFLDEPIIGKNGRLSVAALVNDFLGRIDRRANLNELQFLTGESSKIDGNRLQLVSLACWLLADKWLFEANLKSEFIQKFLNFGIAELAPTIRADKCVIDAERREEFARFCLGRLNFRPAGESKNQAIDRLSALSSLERQRLLRESQAAEKRAREIREALAKKAAQESADKWTRE